MPASFALLEGVKICADIGSDINLMPEKLLKSIIDRGCDIAVANIKVPIKYSLAAETTNEANDI